MKAYNLLNEDQSQFLSNNTVLGGWVAESGTVSFKRLNGAGIYSLFIPQGLQTADADPVGNVLQATSDSSSPFTLVTEFISLPSAPAVVNFAMDYSYTATTLRELTVSIDFYSREEEDSLIASDSRYPSLTVSEASPNIYYLASIFSVAPITANYVKVRIQFSDETDLISAGDSLLIYNPRLVEFSNMSAFAYSVYTTLPEFMRLDDDNIASLTDVFQQPQPLRRFVDALCARMSSIDETVDAFTYTRATYGDYQESALTDPVTTDEKNLDWLAAITATKLLKLASGFSPWAAIESYDGPDADSVAGEWEDVESLGAWINIENIDPDFFDTVRNYRNQILTGFSGTKAGTKVSIEDYVRTILNTSSPESEVVTFVGAARDNPNLSVILLSPGADPDPGGLLVSNIINFFPSAGTECSATNDVVASGRSNYNMDELLLASSSETDAVGSSLYAGKFVSDSTGHGANIILNSTGESVCPDLGGGIGTAHYEKMSAFFSGNNCYWDVTGLTAELRDSLDVTDASGGLDIVVEFSHFHDDPADGAQGALGVSYTADWWKWRNKRVLLAGKSDSSANDWALLVVSGNTINYDPNSYIMYVEGYNSMTSTNFVVSDAVDLVGESKEGSAYVRVRRESDGTVKLYLQKSLFDEWDTNKVGEGAIVSTMVSSPTNPTLQIGGTLTSFADQCSTEFHRVMIFKPLNSSLSGSAEATYQFVPEVDVNFYSQDNYVDQFTTASGHSASLSAPASNDSDIYVYRNNAQIFNGESTIWHFGSGASFGDVLTLTGLNSGNTYYPFVHEINEDGSISTVSETAISGVSSHAFSFSDYGGVDLAAIEVSTTNNNGGGVSAHTDAIAYFLPSTLSAGASAGSDTLGGAWELDRAWPTSDYPYTPSQPIDSSYFSTYKGMLDVKRKVHLEHYSDFSFAIRLRRHWSESGVSFNIFSVLGLENQGFSAIFDGELFVANYSDGTLTESVQWQEDPIFGEWHNYVYRRSAVGGSTLWVDGVEVDTAAALSLDVFPSATNTCRIGEGSSYTPRLEIASLSTYDRYLSDLEVLLLNDQLSG